MLKKRDEHLVSKQFGRQGRFIRLDYGTGLNILPLTDTIGRRGNMCACLGEKKGNQGVPGSSSFLELPARKDTGQAHRSRSL